MWAKLLGRRLLFLIPTLFGLLSLNFALIHLAPGDPTDVLVHDSMEDEEIEQLRQNFGFDQPLYVQYARYLERVVFHFDFGTSIGQNQPTIDVVASVLPNTLLLGFAAICVQFGLGIGMGVLSALQHRRPLDGVIRVVSLVFYSTPSFYVGLLLLMLFCGGVFRWLPSSGMYDVVEYPNLSAGERFVDRLAHLVLPATALGIGAAAVVARYSRAQLLEALKQDYVRTARAKGLPEHTVVVQHALRNALLPVITVFGASIPAFVSGSVIIENVFAWPGLGRLAVQSIFEKDVPLFLTINLVYAVLVVGGNLTADLLSYAADPRIRRT
ncbi:MAG: ABC transporter permease [Planctomycetota bacterium]